MKPTAAARTVQLTGAVLFIVAVVIVIGGNTAVPMLVVAGVLAVAGIVIALKGDRMYKRAAS
jgi:hypothetical protein